MRCFEKSNNIKEQGAGISISSNGLGSRLFKSYEAFNNVSRQPNKAIFQIIILLIIFQLMLLLHLEETYIKFY